MKRASEGQKGSIRGEAEETAGMTDEARHAGRFASDRRRSGLIQAEGGREG